MYTFGQKKSFCFKGFRSAGCAQCQGHLKVTLWNTSVKVSIKATLCVSIQ